MKILSIGNSFSQDAHRYLHGIAKKDGINIKVVNLYIGGCTLRTHYINMLEDNSAYNYEFNGEFVGIKASIKQALLSDEWDVVTLQQASPYSFKPESYFPYIECLADYVKKYCPNSKIYIHQTWAYEDGCERYKTMGVSSSKEMLDLIEKANKTSASKISANGIIPSGLVMMKALELGVEKVHRDCYHASFGVGRYLLALCWYKYFTGNDINNNDFDDFLEEVTEKERKIAIDAVNSIIK